MQNTLYALFSKTATYTMVLKEENPYYTNLLKNRQDEPIGKAIFVQFVP